MARRITELSVFISCPTNVNDLRGVAEAAITEINDVLTVTSGISLKAITWREDIVPGVAADGQEVINQQTLKHYDIYLGMIGTRFGTATPRAGSGTEEEFDLALTQFRQDPTSIRILFYLQAFGVNPFDISPGELQKVLNFKAKLQHQGVLYGNLASLDDALTSIKSHLLKLVTSEWDETKGQWKDVSTVENSEQDIQVEEKTEIGFPENRQSASEEASTSELGLLELQATGQSELAKAGECIIKLGANLNSLTDKTNRKFANIVFDESSGLAGAQLLVDAYSLDIDDFISDSRGELANAGFHLAKGADHIEALYKEIDSHQITPGESATEVANTVDSIEPSLRGFRSSVITAKQGVSRLPPMTKKFKKSQKALVDFFDQTALEITLVLERLSLLKARLGNLGP